jgi:hypothetical protein
MHERSTDPDVVKRLQAETEWAVKARRRYVELTPDDAVALQARIEELEEKLLDAEDDRHSAVMAAQHRAGADRIAERDALKARVAELEAALCAGLRDNLPGSVWDERARAVLTKGEKT